MAENKRFNSLLPPEGIFTDINKDALKNVFLRGETHADTSIFPIDSQDVVSSYDTASIYENYMN